MTPIINIIILINHKRPLKEKKYHYFTEIEQQYSNVGDIEDGFTDSL